MSGNQVIDSMELVTLLLSGLLGLVSPVGLVAEQIAESAIRDRLFDAEILQVRLDNRPNYRLVQGRVDQVRLAGRGLFPVEGARIDTIELETDAIALNPQAALAGQVVLERPLNAGVRLLLLREDLKQTLQSPALVDWLQELDLTLPGAIETEQPEVYDLINPQVDFLEGDRLRLQVTLEEATTGQQNRILVEFGLRLISPYQLQLLDPIVQFDDEPVPIELIQPFAAGISRQLDLRRLEEAGLTIRVLQFELDPDQLAIAAFVRIDPSFTAPDE